MVIYAASRVGVGLGLEQSQNVRVRYPKFDITDRQSIQDLVTQIRPEHGGLDVLINNAGLNVTRPVSSVKPYED
jgi:NAD(P)-dependent dehydrogenase (short-subunit alcohol dehydrogenase family)